MEKLNEKKKRKQENRRNKRSYMDDFLSQLEDN